MAKKFISLLLVVSFGFALIPDCFAQKKDKPAEVIKEREKPKPTPPPPPPKKP